MVETLLVANNFDCHVLICLVVQRAYHLSEAALSNHLENLVAITNVVVNYLRRKKVLIKMNILTSLDIISFHK